MEDLINALNNLQEAQAEYSEAAKNCEYDRSYFLYREEKAVENAKKELEEVFKNEVSKIVKQVLTEQNTKQD